MANLRSLVKRRKAVRNIRKITKTMELIATSRFQRALKRATEAEAYTRKIAELAADLSKNAGDVSAPAARTAAGQKDAAAWSSRRTAGCAAGTTAASCGRRSRRSRKMTADNVRVRPGNLRPPRDHVLQASSGSTRRRRTPSSRTSRRSSRWTKSPVGTSICSSRGQVDQIRVAYMKFENAARQKPVVETLLPLSSVSEARRWSVSPR